MISYGSQQHHAEMPYEDCSHQLGEGQDTFAVMPYNKRPSRLVYGGQKSATGTSPRHRLHQLGEGHKSVSEVPSCAHPPRLVYGSQSRYAAMPCNQLLPPVRGGSGNRRRNAICPSPFPISFTGAKNPPQDRHTDTASTSLREPLLPRSNAHLWSLPLIYQGKGQLTITGMS